MPGPTTDLRRLAASGRLARLPPEVGAAGDLADVGLARLRPPGVGATPRRTPRGQPRPKEDVASHQAGARRRGGVEQPIGRMRRYRAVTPRDRHHRQCHTARTRAVARLANLPIAHRLPSRPHLGERGQSTPRRYRESCLLRASRRRSDCSTGITSASRTTWTFSRTFVSVRKLFTRPGSRLPAGMRRTASIAIAPSRRGLITSSRATATCWIWGRLRAFPSSPRPRFLHEPRRPAWYSTREARTQQPHAARTPARTKRGASWAPLSWVMELGDLGP